MPDRAGGLEGGSSPLRDTARELAAAAASALSRIGFAGDPITIALRRFAGADSDVPLSEAITAAESSATWTAYVPSNWTSRLADRSKTALVATTDGLRFGAYHVGPHAVYHEHGHPAREVYLLVEGSCEFLTARGWRPLAAGDASVQEPDEVHALKTGDEGFVAFWAWVGDVESPIWGIDENGDRFLPEREPR